MGVDTEASVKQYSVSAQNPTLTLFFCVMNHNLDSVTEDSF